MLSRPALANVVPAHQTAATCTPPAHAQAAAADAWRQQAELVYNGSFASSFVDTTYPPLVEALPHVTFEGFLRIVALIFTRTFSPHISGDMQIFSPYMLPLVTGA